MIARTHTERASRQAGLDEAGTPGLWTLLAALLGGAAAWSLHFLLSYVLLAVGCSTRWSGARPALLVLSLVALAATIASGWIAWRQWRVAREIDTPTDDAWDARMGERTARVSFLMVLGLFFAGLFALGIVYEAITVWLAPLCEPGRGM